MKSLTAVVFFAFLAGCGSSHWTDKASANEHAASDRVGGFSDDDKRLYHAGVQHIANAHQKPGSFTIGQVIDQERHREDNRSAARDREAERQQKIAQQRLDAKASVNLASAISAANTLGPHMYAGSIMDGDNCGVRIDADAYENAGNQDQSLIKDTVVKMCSASYTELGGNDSRHLPSDGLHVRMYDLASNVLYSDVVTAAAQEPEHHGAPKKVAQSGRGAYKVLQHWDLPCSGKGGFGEKVIVLSGKQADLESAMHRWLAANNPDKSQCLDLEAFSTMKSFDAFEHASNYTDAQLDAIPTGLNYSNNGVTGSEEWTVGGGPEHVLRKADS